ncbi:unnamed protein product [Pleuronectes platessa]|uniref:Uncharacterized protein n=1 Tax=Pleuronectes platessa TaxID=8262 RepID=A0A9N7U8U2_PLEPL|nr:unnamed protein product [Pleuronectes platessa]
MGGDSERTGRRRHPEPPAACCAAMSPARSPPLMKFDIVEMTGEGDCVTEAPVISQSTGDTSFSSGSAEGHSQQNNDSIVNGTNFDFFWRVLSGQQGRTAMQRPLSHLAAGHLSFGGLTPPAAATGSALTLYCLSAPILSPHFSVWS